MSMRKIKQLKVMLMQKKVLKTKESNEND